MQAFVIGIILTFDVPVGPQQADAVGHLLSACHAQQRVLQLPVLAVVSQVALHCSLSLPT